MNLHYFFEGKLSREEVSSAFLATLLEQSPGFRDRFLELLSDIAGFSQAKEWRNPEVEADGVDVRLEAADKSVVILIENKLFGSAIRKDQLLGYYRNEMKTSSDRQIIAVLLGPRGEVGGEEIRRIEKAPDFRRGRDVARLVTWEDLAEKLEDLPTSGSDTFMRSGFAAVQKVIEAAANEKYPLEGDRVVIDKLIRDAFARLSQLYPAIRFLRWRGQNSHTIFTSGGDVTVYVKICFDAEEKSPYRPVGVRLEDGLHVTLESEVGPSGKGLRRADLRDQWRAFQQDGGFEVPDVGRFTHSQDRWFRYRIPAQGTEEALVGRVVKLGRRVLEATKEHFSP